MNTMFLALLAVAWSLFLLPVTQNYVHTTPDVTDIPSVVTEDDDAPWNENAIQWLLDAQSPNGGWGAGSHAFQDIRDPHKVQTDPATTSFAAMALLKAGGPLKSNPYQKQILSALDRILKDIDARPDNGRITSLDGTQPQIKLGQHIDASMALQFLTDVGEQLEDKVLKEKTDEAADICIKLLQNSQNENGGWAGGGWAPVLQSAMANNALEKASGRYDVDQKAMERSRDYQAKNIAGESVRAEDAAGIPLYAVASAQRATAVEAREAESYFSPTTVSSYSSGKAGTEELVKELRAKGMDKEKADRLANSYAVNQSSTKALQDENIWEGFGNNGGEEYLSYMLTSEALAQQSKEEWLKWKQSIAPKFKDTQNPNGSWSGHHCITSPVFCTAAILQAWYAM